MNFLEKYKLYRSIIKQEPVDLVVYGKYQSIFFEPTIVFEKLTYFANGRRVAAFTKFEIVGFTKNHQYIIQPRNYNATVTIDQGKSIEYIEFKSLLAKKLFNHGKKYNK